MDKKYNLSLAVFVCTSLILSMIQIMADKPMLMLERFIPGGGWLQIIILSGFGSFLVYKMQNPSESAKWRRRSWLIFAIYFFVQFALGLFADERFLMSGKLHLPIPFMILAGPIYRGQMSVMPLLFISSIILSGPAWCSQFCYFGAYDSLMIKAKKSKTKKKKNRFSFKMRPIRNKWLWKNSFLFIVIFCAIMFRLLGFEGLETLVPALVFGVIGIGIMVVISRKRRKMVHCVTFCPIGTIVNYTKFLSPFRLRITSSCTDCYACIPSCRYDALNKADISNRKPGLTCTLCGDCVSKCHDQAIEYRFFKFDPEKARKIYLFITISLFILCLGMGRM